jgi:uncharacterized membrane protein
LNRRRRSAIKRGVKVLVLFGGFFLLMIVVLTAWAIVEKAFEEDAGWPTILAGIAIVLVACVLVFGRGCGSGAGGDDYDPAELGHGHL